MKKEGFDCLKNARRSLENAYLDLQWICMEELTNEEEVEEIKSWRKQIEKIIDKIGMKIRENEKGD